ncbi:MAG: hypothetical protein HYU66_20870, partial [Armatimonadetes bacterium]|nr:hypothetical protein [Armatimonadota bacterium]
MAGVPALALWACVALTAMASGAILPAGPQAVAFPVREARFVRFVIHASHQSEPCLDELEVYGPDSPANLALASSGAKPSASSLLQCYAIHQIPHLNDGLYGNPQSWIAGAAVGWAQIELPRAAQISRVVFSRDREAHYQDRVPTAFEVQLSLDGERWETVAKVDGPEPEQPKLDLPDVYQRAATWQETLRQAGDRLLSAADELTRQDDARLRDSLGDSWAWFTREVRDAAWWDADTVLWVQGRRILKDRRSVLLAEAMTGLRERLQLDFTAPGDLRSMAWEQRDRIWDGAWQPGDLAALAQRYAAVISSARQPAALLLARSAKDADGLSGVRELYLLDQRCREALAELPWRFNPPAMRRAIGDLAARCPDRYPHGDAYLAQVDAYERRLPELRTALAGGSGAAARRALALHDEIFAFQRRALVEENPVIDFDRVLLIRHRSPGTPPGVDPGTWSNGLRFGLPFNWESDFSFAGKAPWWEDRIETVSLRDPSAAPQTVWQPEPGTFLQHLDLNWDADRVLFAMVGGNGRWQVFEVGADGQGFRQVSPGTEPDVDNGDPCYLPDGRIVFNSNRCFSGVPCINGSSYITNLCLMNPDGSGQRMLTFDQENNWHPVVLNNGRVLYTRYEYADVSHQFPGLLFHMNPDGTEQMEFYGSNSYWPNRIYFPRPVPGRPTEVVGVVCGHHGPNRNGRLVLFDPARGRTEADGVVQTIPGWGQKVEPITQDELYGGVWPKFLHPYPLSDRYFLAAGRPNPEAGFGLWLVDVFDNLVLLRDEPGFSLCEPIPLRPRARPPAIPDKVRLERNDATVYLVDVYRGQALGGVPRGSVKSLRVFTYNYTYREKVACGYGPLSTPGIDGPWAPRRILGTVPVQTDGSAFFKVPANTPISVQPLDSDGRALQLMRSWFTAMPGEVGTCVGCHDRQSSAPQAGLTLAASRAPVAVSPWRGPARGFDFEREVQPVLDRHCAGCHGD